MLTTDIQYRQSYLARVRKTLDSVIAVLQQNFGGAEVLSELCQMRGYEDPKMFAHLADKGVFKMPYLSDIQILMQNKLDAPTLRHLGLIDDAGNYLLEGRYAIPIRNYSGVPLALVCWYPDKRKYITTGTLGFTNTATFFNADTYKQAFKFPDGISRAFVVEGIFDALSISSLGYCAFGNQGLPLSPVKKEMLSRFDRVYFIPDNDAPGRKSNKYLCTHSSHLWDTDNGYLIQIQSHTCKDMDDVIKKGRLDDLDSWITDNRLLRVSI